MVVFDREYYKIVTCVLNRNNICIIKMYSIRTQILPHDDGNINCT